MGEMFDAWDGFHEEDQPYRLEYLKFIRDVVFGSKPNLEVVKCHKFPEFGMITRNEVDELIDALEACEYCNGEGCQYCTPGLTKSEPKYIDLGFRENYTIPGTLAGTSINVEADEVKETMDPDFWERQAANALAKAEVLRSVPQSDTFEDGSILTFEKTFQTQSTAPTQVSYQYATIKQAGLWHTTGDKAPNGIFWSQLLQFIGMSNLQTLKVLDTAKSVTMAEYVKGMQKALEAEEQ